MQHSQAKRGWVRREYCVPALEGPGKTTQPQNFFSLLYSYHTTYYLGFTIEVWGKLNAARKETKKENISRPIETKQASIFIGGPCLLPPFSTFTDRKSFEVELIKMKDKELLSLLHLYVPTKLDPDLFCGYCGARAASRWNKLICWRTKRVCTPCHAKMKSNSIVVTQDQEPQNRQNVVDMSQNSEIKYLASLMQAVK